MRMRTSLVCLHAAFVLLASSNAAVGSEQSKRLYARALVDFNAGRYAPALDGFDQAVHADPQDFYALYYRGVTRGRLGDLPGAISDLRAVVDSKAPIQQAPLELGVALVQSGANADAVPYLQRAQAEHALDAQASLFLGIAFLRLQQNAAARQNFERAAARDPSLRLSATYYEGVLNYRAGNTQAAEEQFSYVARTSPSSEMGHEATQFLQQIRRGVGAAYHLYAQAGLQYDSNVVLAPSDNAADEIVKGDLGISNESDGRGIIEAGGTYAPWRTDKAQLSVGYDFYQSLHFRLNQFNLQDHRAAVELSGRAGGTELGVLGRYDYYFLDTDSFLQEFSALPWVTIPEGAMGRTEMFYRERRRDFFKQAFRIRDAFNHSPGIRQVMYLGSEERDVFLGYRFDREDPVHDDQASKAFGYDGHQLEVGVDWTFPFDLSGELSYIYRHEDYDSASDGRIDNDHQVVVAAHKQLTEQLALLAAYWGTFDNSTKTFFDYQRHVVSLALEWRL